jgi:uncharacterized iron-regulated protein
MKKLTSVLFTLFVLTSFFELRLNLLAGDFPAYQIFNKDGSSKNFDKILKEAEDADIIFFGELHNNPIAHWLELELTKALYEKKKDQLVLGAEMFEADDQLKIDEYFSGLIGQKNFEKESRVWNNYQTDYKPLVEFAKEKKLKFIATNIPRRYASIVSRSGFIGLDSLSSRAKEYIAPLPIIVDMNLPGYKKIAEDLNSDTHKPEGMPKMPEGMAAMMNKDSTMKMDTAGMKMKGGMPPKMPPEMMARMAKKDNDTKTMPDSINSKMKPSMPPKMPPPEGMAKMDDKKMPKMNFIAEAQASKDATMSYFILKNYKDGNLFLHFDGAYHSNNDEGIVWFIKKAKPNMRIITISTVEQEKIDDLADENKGLADFIIVVPDEMTKTY